MRTTLYRGGALRKQLSQLSEYALIAACGIAAGCFMALFV